MLEKKDPEEILNLKRKLVETRTQAQQCSTYKESQEQHSTREQPEE
jgi:hypothetical protein